ncbi:Auxilin-related protein 2 [Bienertia sinuspersici]
MNDFQGLLSSDYGFKPQGKAAPMAPPKSTSNSSSNSPFNFEIGGSKTSASNSKSSSSFMDDPETLFRPNRKTPIDDLGNLDDVFSVGGSKLNSSKSVNNNSSNSVNLDSIFGGVGGGGGGDSGSKFSSLPVFDKPVYDEDVSSSAKYEDIFSSSSSSYAKKGDAFDDLLGGLGKKEQKSAKSGSVSGSGPKAADKGGIPSFDDLLPGFGESASPPVSSLLWIFTDPLEEIGNLTNSGKKTAENLSSGGVFDDIDPLGGFAKSVPAFSVETNSEEKDGSSLGAGARVSGRQTSVSEDAIGSLL